MDHPLKKQRFVSSNIILEDNMKKGPRCPVCGSLQVKVLRASDPQKKDESKETETSEKKDNWKCYDCYRQFPKPDES